MCLKAFYAFFQGKASSPAFDTLIKPYGRLLFQVIFVMQSQNMNQQRLRSYSHSFLNSEEQEEVEELTACEVFIQVLKTGLDKPNPLISQAQLKVFIEQMIDVVREQILIKQN